VFPLHAGFSFENEFFDPSLLVVEEHQQNIIQVHEFFDWVSAHIVRRFSGRLSKGHFVIPGPLRSAGLALKVCEKITGYSKLSNASASNSRRVSRGTVKQSLTAVNENVKSVELKMCVWASVL